MKTNKMGSGEWLNECGVRCDEARERHKNAVEALERVLHNYRKTDPVDMEHPLAVAAIGEVASTKASLDAWTKAWWEVV